MRGRRPRRSTATIVLPACCRRRRWMSSGSTWWPSRAPLTTPVGEGFRSLNVTLRQVLDLYVCLRPVRYFKGVPSPVLRPHLIDMVIFRENTEDIYAGIEWETGTPEAEKVVKFLREEMGVKSIRFPDTASIGIKPVSIEGLGTPDPGGHPLRRGGTTGATSHWCTRATSRSTPRAHSCAGATRWRSGSSATKWCPGRSATETRSPG